MFEGTYSPPFYLDLYNFKNGSQDDIFLDSYASIPPPSPTQSEIPTPINHPVPQPSQTNMARRNSVAGMTREPGVLGFMFQALFSSGVAYARDAF